MTMTAMTDKKIRLASCECCDGKFEGETRTAVCPGCAKKFKLCDACWDGWIACRPKCKKKWRADAAKGLSPDKLPHGAEGRPRKNEDDSQGDLFEEKDDATE